MTQDLKEVIITKHFRVNFFQCLVQFEILFCGIECAVEWCDFDIYLQKTTRFICNNMHSNLPFFNPEIPLKGKVKSPHPWENHIKHIYSRTYKYSHNSGNNPQYPLKEDKIKKEGRIKLTVIGNRIAKEYIYCLHVVKALYKYRPEEYKAPIIRGVTSVEWPLVLHDMQSLFGGLTYCAKSQVAVFLNDEYLGGENELKNHVESKFVFNLNINYYREGIKQLAKFISCSERPCAYLHISIDEKPVGVLIFQLYSDIVPRTCENFLRLCETNKGGYSGTPVHRIVKDCWIQCGGFGLKNNSNLDCENFIVPHDRRGVLCMANDGRHVDCSTQFFVLLQPAPWMKHKYVAFGQLIEGESTLTKIESVPTWYESPTVEIKIFKSGVLKMECHRISTNKNTTIHTYIDGHIDELYTIGKIFYEHLLESVFLETELRRAKEQQTEFRKEGATTEEFAANNIQKSQKITQKEETNRNKPELATISGSFIEEYEDEYQSPKKLFYLPLTDVPYPGEVDSTFDLKKFLRGDYCLESDLDQNGVKRKSRDELTLDVPEILLDDLFECFQYGREDSADQLNVLDDDDIKQYINDSVDEVSFAGPVVIKMASLHKKFDVFEDTQREKTGLLSDEEIRLMRVAAREFEKSRYNKSASSDLKLVRFASKDYRIDSDRKVPISATSQTGHHINRVPTGFIRSPTTKQIPNSHDRAHRQSVLSRLYEDVAISDDDDDVGPTLKQYKPLSETSHHDDFALLKHGVPIDDSGVIQHYATGPGDSLLHMQHDTSVLNLQHGTKVARKISSDYARAIEQFDHYRHNSIRSLEFAKRRPSMSVSEYQKRTQKYLEELNATLANDDGIETSSKQNPDREPSTRSIHYT